MVRLIRGETTGDPHHLQIRFDLSIVIALRDSRIAAGIQLRKVHGCDSEGWRYGETATSNSPINISEHEERIQSGDTKTENILRLPLESNHRHICTRQSPTISYNYMALLLTCQTPSVYEIGKPVWDQGLC